MRIHQHCDSLPTDARGAVLALAGFDSLHPGQQAVIGAARVLARERGAPLAALVFAGQPARLASLRRTARGLERLGVDHLFVERGGPAGARSAFPGAGLAGTLSAGAVVAGEGYLADGGAAARAAGLDLIPVSTVAAPDGGVLCAGRIRQTLVAGRPGEAAALLGRPWIVEARVVAGQRLGHDLGWPTANLRLGDRITPALGIYAVRAVPGDGDGDGEPWIDGVASLGSRPTFDDGEILLEVHLFDWSGDLYGRRLAVAFVERIREEKKFDDIPALQAQIARDCEAARLILAGWSDGN